MLKGRGAHIILTGLLFTVMFIVLGGNSASGQRVYATATNDGGTLIIGSISNAGNAINSSDTTDYSTISSLIGLFGLVGDYWQNISFPTNKPGINSPITIKFGNPGSLASIVNGVFIQKTNNGSDVGTAYSGASISGILVGTSQLAEMTITETGFTYDGVRVKVSSSVLGLGLSARLYYAFFITPPSIDPKTVCSGSPVTLTVKNPYTGYYYNWYNSSNTLVQSSASTSYTFTPSTNTTYYVEAVELGNPVNHYSARIPVTITINPISSGAIGTSQTICTSGTPTAFTNTGSATTTGAGIISYQWQKSIDNITFNNIPSATSATYTEPAALTQTTYYRRVATSTLNSVGCSAISNVITVTVNTLNPGSVGSSQAICFNTTPSSFTDISSAVGAGTVSYQWKKSTDNVSFTDIPSATSATFTETLSLTQITYYRRVASSVLNTVVCNSTSNTITVTVNPLPTITLGTAPSACQEITSAPLIYTGTTGSPVTYSITWSGAALTAGFTNVSNVTLPASPITLTIPGAAPMAAYSGTIVVKNAGCESTAVPFTFTIHPKPATPSFSITTSN